MTCGFFVTGTDTGVGKTCATVALMRALQSQGKRVVGMKPVASGCRFNNGQLQNDDALLLQAQASLPLPYTMINPYAYAKPLSPHIAGIENPVDLAVVLHQFAELQKLADGVVVEGAGGWFSPINARQSNADLACALALPVILVVAIRLGCINHARLSFMAIRHSRQPFAGWIAVATEPLTEGWQANIAKISDDLAMPPVGLLPFLPQLDFDFLAAGLNLGCLGRSVK